MTNKKPFISEIPELLVIWDDYNNSKDGIYPCNITGGSRKKVWWVCNIHGSYQMEPHRKTGKTNRGCPSCGKQRRADNQVVSPMDKSLGTLYPHLVCEWNDEIDIFTVYPQSNRMYIWKCIVDNTHGNYSMSADSRTRNNKPRGCPKCGILKCSKSRSTAPYEKSLGYLFENLINEWADDTSIFTVYPGSHENRKWICLRDSTHGIYLTPPHNRTNKFSGCPICKEFKLEKEARLFFDKSSISYTRQYELPELPRNYFDYCFDYNSKRYLLELDGIQHFELCFFHLSSIDLTRSQDRDRIKTHKALQLGYSIIRIDHTQLNTIPYHINAAISSQEPLYFSTPSMYTYITEYLVKS